MIRCKILKNIYLLSLLLKFLIHINKIQICIILCKIKITQNKFLSIKEL